MNANQRSGSKTKWILGFLLAAVLIGVFRKKAPPPPTAEVEETEAVNASGDLSKTAGPLIGADSSPAAPVLEAPHELTATELEKIKQLRNQAKMTLAAGYTALISYRAEYDRFTTDLKAMGFYPTGNRLNSKAGFLTPDQPVGSDQVAANFDTDTFTDSIPYDPLAAKINLSDYAKYCERGCTASDTEFEMILVLPLLSDKHVDVWLINEKKEMHQVVDGLK